MRTLDAYVGPYRSQAARDAQRTNYGKPSYWAYLDEHTAELAIYFTLHGDHEMAKRVFTESLSESLQGNDGD